jgi:hypothetical protein
MGKKKLKIIHTSINIIKLHIGKIFKKYRKTHTNKKKRINVDSRKKLRNGSVKRGQRIPEE